MSNVDEFGYWVGQGGEDDGASQNVTDEDGAYIGRIQDFMTDEEYEAAYPTQQ